MNLITIISYAGIVLSIICIWLFKDLGSGLFIGSLSSVILGIIFYFDKEQKKLYMSLILSSVILLSLSITYFGGIFWLAIFLSFMLFIFIFVYYLSNKLVNGKIIKSRFWNTLQLVSFKILVLLNYKENNDYLKIKATVRQLNDELKRKILSERKKEVENQDFHIQNQSKTFAKVNKPVKPQRNTPTFIGIEQQIKIAGYTLDDPLIYVINSDKYINADSSLICLKAKIGPPAKILNDKLGYYPQTARLEPYQLGNYIEWLSNGRNNPEIDMGYVFLFFYGLERRVLVDGKDIVPIGNELIRLMKTYRTSGSLITYASRLLSYLVMLKKLKPTEKLITKLLDFQDGYIDDYLQIMLHGYLAKNNLPMPYDWALRFCAQDKRVKRSKITDDVSDEFTKLFEKKYKEKYGSGIQLKVSSKDYSIDYKPASPSLMYHSDNLIPTANWPSVSQWIQTSRPLINMWNECIEELRVFARKVSSKGVDSVEAYNALPEDLKGTTEHPYQKEWEQLLDTYMTDYGTTMLPVYEIAKFHNIEKRSRLTLAQSYSIVETVESLGSSIEPDARYFNKSYPWNDKVAIIKLPDEPHLSEGQNYLLASMVLKISLQISQADGITDNEEKQVIIEFIEERFMLNRNDRIRLKALLDVQLAGDLSIAGLKKSITSKFNTKQRESLGKFLISIAGASEGICKEEKTALKKTFKTLDIDQELVDVFIQEMGYLPQEKPVRVENGVADSHGEKIPDKKEEIDWDLVRKKKEESEAIAKQLLEIMNNNSQNDNNIATTLSLKDSNAEQNSSVLDFSDLRKDLHPILFEIIKSETWQIEQFDVLTRKHGLSCASVLEEINTWADEYLGDFLLEEGDSITVNTYLLN